MVWLTEAATTLRGGGTGMTTLVTAALAGLLAIGTAVGVVQALNSSSSDRVTPTTSAPVYGAR
jgi:hypothetical protein